MNAPTKLCLVCAVALLGSGFPANATARAQSSDTTVVSPVATRGVKARYVRNASRSIERALRTQNSTTFAKSVHVSSECVVDAACLSEIAKGSGRVVAVAIDRIGKRYRVTFVAASGGKELHKQSLTLSKSELKSATGRRLAGFIAAIPAPSADSSVGRTPPDAKEPASPSPAPLRADATSDEEDPLANAESETAASDVSPKTDASASSDTSTASSTPGASSYWSRWSIGLRVESGGPLYFRDIPDQMIEATNVLQYGGGLSFLFGDELVDAHRIGLGVTWNRTARSDSRKAAFIVPQLIYETGHPLVLQVGVGANVGTGTKGFADKYSGFASQLALRYSFQRKNNSSTLSVSPGIVAKSVLVTSDSQLSSAFLGAQLEVSYLSH